MIRLSVFAVAAWLPACLPLVYFCFLCCFCNQCRISHACSLSAPFPPLHASVSLSTPMQHRQADKKSWAAPWSLESVEVWSSVLRPPPTHPFPRPLVCPLHAAPGRLPGLPLPRLPLALCSRSSRAVTPPRTSPAESSAPFSLPSTSPSLSISPSLSLPVPNALSLADTRSSWSTLPIFCTTPLSPTLLASASPPAPWSPWSPSPCNPSPRCRLHTGKALAAAALLTGIRSGVAADARSSGEVSRRRASHARLACAFHVAL